MRVLIWDFDNTIGERIGGWSSAVLDALDATGMEHQETLETIRPHLRSGYPWHCPDVIRAPQTHRQWWSDLGENVFLPYFLQVPNISQDTARMLSMSMDQYYLRPDRWRLLEGALHSLEWSKQNGYTNVLLTNNAAGIETILDSLNLTVLFETVINSADTGVEKPHPLAWKPIIERHGKHEIDFMIGDSVSADVVGANAVGIKSILVGNQSSQATVCVQRVAEIPETLSKHHTSR